MNDPDPILLLMIATSFCSRVFFIDAIASLDGGIGVNKAIHLRTFYPNMKFQKIKKKWFFTVFWGDLEGAG